MIPTQMKLLRVKKGWTQADLAKITGISDPLLSLYERNLRKPKPYEKKIIADALGSTPEELFLPEDEFDSASGAMTLYKKLKPKLNLEEKEFLFDVPSFDAHLERVRILAKKHGLLKEEENEKK